MTVTRRGARIDLLLSLGVIALGAAAAVVALRLPSAGGYSRIGPNVMPVAVSIVSTRSAAPMPSAEATPPLQP